MAAYGSADLDAPSDDPSWGTGNDASDFDADIEFYKSDGGRISEPICCRSYLVAQGPAAYETCNTSGYSSSDVQAAKLKKPHAVLCVMTTGNRISVVSLKSVASSSIMLHVITYENDDD